MADRHYALAREAILAALTAYTGITTADGATPANNTLICADLINRNDFITNKAILIGSGDAKFEDSGASLFVPGTGTITVVSAFSAQIKAGTIFRVLNISSVEIDVARIEEKIDALAGGAFWGSYGPRNVEVDNDVDFGIMLYDPSGNIITTGDITPGTYTVHRIRGAVDTEIVGSTASSEAAGRVYMTYNFPAASWAVGDILYITFSGIKVTIDTTTTEYPDLFIWGRVVREADISSKVDAVEAKLEVAQYYDRIFFDEDTGIAGTAWPKGTPQVPSDVIADIITMCAARNLHKINVHGALTLGAAMQHYCFFGSEHEDVTDVLNLNSKDVDGSHIEGLIVTGGQGGAGYLTLIRCIVNVVTTFQGRMNWCSFWSGICSFKDGGYIDLVDCESIYGVVTITVQAPARASIKNWRGNLILTAQDGGTCFVRGFKGSLQIGAMTAGTLSVYANGADIAIIAGCTGGTINIYGNATVTGAGAGVTINNYTLDTDLATVDTVVDAIKVATDKLAGATPVSSSTTANWNTGTGTSGESGDDVVTIGANDTKNKLHSLLLDVSALTDGASIRVKLFMQVNGVEKKVYDQAFTVPTGTTPPDTDGLWIVNGSVGIHEALRVEVYSDQDESVAIGYDYMLEVM